MQHITADGMRLADEVMFHPTLTQEDLQVTISYTRSQGIRAIMDLQLMAGILEDSLTAEKRWDAYESWEKALTEIFHRKFFKEGKAINGALARVGKRYPRRENMP